jgi:hypothetical protein
MKKFEGKVEIFRHAVSGVILKTPFQPKELCILKVGER